MIFLSSVRVVWGGGSKENWISKVNVFSSLRSCRDVASGLTDTDRQTDTVFSSLKGPLFCCEKQTEDSFTQFAVTMLAMFFIYLLYVTVVTY